MCLCVCNRQLPKPTIPFLRPVGKSQGKKAQIKLNQVKVTLRVMTAKTLAVKTKDRVVVEGLKFNGLGEGQGKGWDAWRPSYCRCCATQKSSFGPSLSKSVASDVISRVSQKLALHHFSGQEEDEPFWRLPLDEINRWRKQTDPVQTSLNCTELQRNSGSISPPCTSITSGTHGQLNIIWLIIL